MGLVPPWAFRANSYDRMGFGMHGVAEARPVSREDRHMHDLNRARIDQDTHDVRFVIVMYVVDDILLSLMLAIARGFKRRITVDSRWYSDSL